MFIFSPLSLYTVQYLKVALPLTLLLLFLFVSFYRGKPFTLWYLYESLDLQLRPQSTFNSIPPQLQVRRCLCLWHLNCKWFLFNIDFYKLSVGFYTSSPINCYLYNTSCYKFATLYNTSFLSCYHLWHPCLSGSDNALPAFGNVYCMIVYIYTIQRNFIPLHRGAHSNA